MLIADIPHSKQAAGKQSEHDYYHRALGVVAVVDVHSRSRCLVGSEQEGIEAIKYGVKLAEASSFFKLRLYLVNFIFESFHVQSLLSVEDNSLVD